MLRPVLLSGCSSRSLAYFLLKLLRSVAYVQRSWYREGEVSVYQHRAHVRNPVPSPRHRAHLRLQTLAGPVGLVDRTLLLSERGDQPVRVWERQRDLAGFIDRTPKTRRALARKIEHPRSNG